MLSVDTGITHSASARLWEGDGFDAKPKSLHR